MFRAPYRASPRQGTFPPPKMPKPPPERRVSTPSMSMNWFPRYRTMACAVVRRVIPGRPSFASPNRLFSGNIFCCDRGESHDTRFAIGFNLFHQGGRVRKIGIGIVGGGYMGKAHAVAMFAVAAVFETKLRPELQMVCATSPD